MKKYLSLVSFMLLASCGGSGGDSGGVTAGSANSGNNPPIIVPPVSNITEENYADIGASLAIFSEGLVEMSDLIESEILWFYHAPEGITTRVCMGGGKVYLQATTVDGRVAGQLEFDNCILEEPKDLFNREAEENIAFNGIVEISYQTQTYDELWSTSRRPLIKQLDLTSKTSDLNFGGIVFTFDFVHSLEQVWQDYNPSMEPLESKLKRKTLNVNNFSFPLYSDGTERIHDATLFQIERSEANSEGNHYEYSLDGTYSSGHFDFSHNYFIDLFSDVSYKRFLRIKRSLNDLKGTIALGSSVNDDRVSLSFIYDYVTLSSNLGETMTAYNEDLFDGQIQVSRPLLAMQPRSRAQIVSISHDGDLSKLNSEGMTIYYDRLVGPEEEETRNIRNFPGQVIDNRVHFEEADINALSNLNNTSDFFTINSFSYTFSNYTVKFNELERYVGPIPFINSEFGTVTPIEFGTRSVKYNNTGFYFGLSSYNARESQPEGILTFGLDGKNQLNYLNYNFNEFCFSQNTGETFFLEQKGDGFVINVLNSNYELTSEIKIDDRDLNYINFECENNLVKIMDYSNRILQYFNMESKDIYTFDLESLTNSEILDFYDSNDLVISPINDQQIIIQHNEIVTINNEQREVALFIFGENQSGSFELTPLLAENTSLITETEYNQDNKLFSDNVNKRVYKDDWVLNLDENKITKPFIGFVFEDGSTETVVNFNPALNVIVTTYGLYDAEDFSLLTTFPKKLRDVEHDDWFTGENQRLCVGLEQYLVFCSHPMTELKH